MACVNQAPEQTAGRACRPSMPEKPNLTSTNQTWINLGLDHWRDQLDPSRHAVRIRARVRHRRSRPGLGLRVSLRVKPLVGAGVAFGIHHATWLPTATAITKPGGTLHVAQRS